MKWSSRRYWIQTKQTRMKTTGSSWFGNKNLWIKASNVDRITQSSRQAQGFSCLYLKNHHWHNTNQICHHPIRQKAPPRLLKQLKIIRPLLWNQLPHNQQRVHKAAELNLPKERKISEQSDCAPFDGEDEERKDTEHLQRPVAIHFWKPPFQRGN